MKKELLDKLTWLWLDLHQDKEVYDWNEFGIKTVEFIEIHENKKLELQKKKLEKQYVDSINNF